MSESRATGQGTAALETAPAGAAGITARNLAPGAESALERAVWAGWAGRIWAGDTEVWTTDAEVSG
ncbi:MAG: hypothetical protein H0X16_12990, partial [Chloroflexi bacterium]|nr:hypothetical protein [Chloroflexota bacterium]